MSKFNLTLTPLLSVQFWQEFNLATLLPYLPAAVSILIYLVSLLTWRRYTKSDVRPQFSQIYQMISNVFSEIHNLSSAFVSPTDQPSQLSDLTTSASQSPEPEPVQQPAQELELPQEVSRMSDKTTLNKDCPVFTCPYNRGSDLGCGLIACAYFPGSETKEALIKFAIEIDDIFKILSSRLHGIIDFLVEEFNDEKH